MKFKLKQKSFLFLLFALVTVIAVIILWRYLELSKIETKATGGSYTEGVVGSPRFINPVLAQSQTDKDLTRLLFTPLLAMKEDGSFDELLIESIDISPDNLKYTINLKKNILFEDGVNVTAEDVLFTIESIQDPLIKSPLEPTWRGVTPKIVDKYSIELTLPRPFGDFLSLLQIGVIPKHIWSKINPQEFIFSTYNTSPIAYGPYRIKKIKQKQNGSPSEYILKKSSSSIETANLKKISFIFFENEDLLFKALKKRSIDAVYGLSPYLMNDIPKHYVIYSEKLPRIFALFLNQTKQSFFESKNIRQALELGINKQFIVEDIFKSYASEIDSALGNNKFNTLYNPEESERLIQAEGWKRGEDGIYTKEVDKQLMKLEFNISSPNIEEMKQVSERIQSDLAAIGVRANIRYYEESDLNQNIIRPREYEALLFGYELERPSDLFSFWHSTQISDPGLNVSLLKNNDLDAALEQVRSKSESLENVETIINNEKPAIFLYSPSYLYILPKEIQDTSLFIKEASDRFNTVRHWFTETRHMWRFFIK